MIERFGEQAQKHNLPPQSSSFIGRDEEIAEITRLLADPACRLLTLVGLGGIGKTRLAVEAATALPNNFADGLYFVPLQSIHTFDFLITAIADTIKFPLTGQADPQVQLLNHLRNKAMLLLLDNFEQLLGEGGATLLADILESAPGVKLFVTSREVLNLQEEWLYPVQGLPVPDSPQTDHFETYGATLLFTARARQVRPDFSLTDEPEAVVRICQLVEGMPLAIELAASWTKRLRCQAIAAEIQRNINFLTTPLRNILERHQSIEAVFQQTWKLLNPEERDVFKRLSVFQGGFRRGVAEQIARATLPVLSALVDKSLLRRESNGRYQMHELLRQYAETRLQASPEETVLFHDRHCRYYTNFLHVRHDDILGNQQLRVVAEIEAELDDVRAAWRWAVEQGKVEEIRRAAPSLWIFYQFQGHYLEGIHACKEAVQSLKRQAPTEQQRLALITLLVPLAWFRIRLGRLEEAEAVLEECQALYTQLGIPPLPGHATDPRLPLGIIASIRGDYARVAELGQEARRISETHDYQENRQFAYYVLARAALGQGDYHAAQRYAQQACNITKKTGDRWFRAYCLNELGNIAQALGDYGEAEQHYQASYALRKAFDDPEGMAVALNHLGEMAIGQENYPEANRLYQHSLAIYEQIGDRGGLARSLGGLGRIACDQGDYQAAQQYYQRALQIAKNIRFLTLTLSLIVSIADLLFQTGQPEQALELLGLVRRHPASDHATKEQVQELLTRYEAEVSPDEFMAALQRGAEHDLEGVLTTLQNELTSPQKQPDIVPPVPASDLPQPPQPLIHHLTSRELEVLQLLSQGLSNREIARELVIAQGTVKTHVHNICRKLGVRNRTQAAAQAQKLQLL